MFHLRVNLSSPMSTHSAHHELLPTDGENSISCQLSISKDATCGIFDIATGDVEIEEVPVTWDIDGHSYNTLTMSCGHTFNPSAAALHFLSQDMRCPICRRGSETQMLIESLPGHLQETFSKKLNGMKERSKTEDSMLDLLQLIEVDVAGIESDFCLVVDISVKTHSRVLLQSPIRSLSLDDEGVFIQFRPQQSFQRILNQHLMFWRHNKDVTLTFSLQHPVIYLPIQTEHLNLHEFLNNHQSDRHAIPFRAYDNTDEHVVATLLVQRQESTTQAIGLFLNRQLMLGLCVACIHNRLRQLVQ